MISLGKNDHSVFYEFFSTRSSDIYLMALHAFMIRPDDAELFDQSFQNYIIDLEDATSKYVNLLYKSLPTFRSMTGQLLEYYVDLVESSLTKIVSLSLSSIVLNLGLPEKPELTQAVEKFEVTKLLVAGKDDAMKLSFTCSSLSILTILAHKTPCRPDLM